MGSEKMPEDLHYFYRLNLKNDVLDFLLGAAEKAAAVQEAARLALRERLQKLASLLCAGVYAMLFFALQQKDNKFGTAALIVAAAWAVCCFFLLQEVRSKVRFTAYRSAFEILADAEYDVEKLKNEQLAWFTFVFQKQQAQNGITASRFNAVLFSAFFLPVAVFAAVWFF